ncbi:hypothetical protein [Nocardia miyunensis]|uniref:hypothetical protein n=1 Tax=Nocardia miyunensis TaxID=282684 RepID=UPI000AE18060
MGLLILLALAVGAGFLIASMTRRSRAMRPQPAPYVVDAVPPQNRVVIDGNEYIASNQQGTATPYYYSGGMVGGRAVSPGWYSTPWWKTALVAGAAGVGGVLLADTLMDGFGHHHMGGMGFGGGFGGFGGPDMGGPGFF